MYKRILVPLDGSKHAESVLPLASKLARIYNAEIILLHVVEYPFEMYSRCEPDTLAHPTRVNEKLQTEKTAFCRDAEQYLKRVAAAIEMNTPRVTVEIQESSVIESILHTVERSRIDLIVMSTVGQDKSPWLMGAITNRVLREAPVPVILLRKGSFASEDEERAQPATEGEDAWAQLGARSMVDSLKR